MKYQAQEIRETICKTMENEETKKELSPILYYDDELLLSPEEWIELMGEKNEHRLACDLPFVQLTAKLIKRNISLLIIKQKDVEKVTNQNNDKDQNTDVEMTDEDFEEKFFTVFGDENCEEEPLTMMYFPQGQFQADAHFQSIRRNHIDKTVLKKLNEVPLHFPTFGTNVDEEDEEDANLDDDFNVTEINTKGNAFNQITLLTPQDPGSSVIMNDTNKVIRKKLKRGPNTKTYEIAPGEARKPQEWLREPTFDIDAFPHLHPEGKFGLHYKRPRPISPPKYFAQRVMHYNDKFARDADYIFMAQQYLERHLLESQISMTMKSGFFMEKEDGKQILRPSEDKSNIFQSIPGTPSYWQKFRNEIYARMEQLGPFHLFYTLSCAEWRWPTVLAEVFRVVEKGKIKIYYPHEEINAKPGNSNSESLKPKAFTGKLSDIKVEYLRDDGVLEAIPIKDMNGKIIGETTQPNLEQFKEWYFAKNKLNIRSFLKDHFILITRIFDHKVKDFHTEIFTKMGIANYAYRVEFQLRGLPQ